MIRRNLRKLRKELGLTQQILADMLNISQSTLSNYESGYRYPSLKILYMYQEIAREKGKNLVITDIMFS